MADAGIETCILSLSTPHIHYGDDALAAQIARDINSEVAEICRAYPDKLKYAATLPLPAVAESIEEIKRNYDELGAVAVKVPSNANGVYLGDASLDPVFEELNARKSIVIIHPSRPKEMPEQVFTAGPAPLFEYLGDTTRAVLNMLANGTLEKYPDIKVIVPHCGSFLPIVAHRMIGISTILVPAGIMPDVDVKGALDKLYFDMAGDALPVGLDALLKIADPSHILYGSDFPYTPSAMIQGNREKFEQYDPIREDLLNMFHDNAVRLFDL